MNSKTLLSVVIVCSIFTGLIVGMFSLKTIEVTSPNISLNDSGNFENLVFIKNPPNKLSYFNSIKILA